MSTFKSNDANQRSFLHEKRSRGEEQFNYSSHHSITSQSPQAHRNSRQDKIQKIVSNFQRIDDVLKKDDTKRLFDNLSKFGFDELSKLLQAIANKEFISLTSMTNHTKEPITLNPSLINFNPENLEVTSQSQPNPFSDDSLAIDKVIIKNSKEKSILKEKISLILSQSASKRKESNVSLPHSVLGTKEYFESITQNIKSILNSKVVDMAYLKNVIKLYSTFIHSNSKLIEQEDQLMLALIGEVLGVSSYGNFFALCNYWLYTEYFLASEEGEYYRYDTLLNEVVTLVDNSRYHNLGELMECWESTWVRFIGQIPRYNARFIEHLFLMHDVYFKASYDSLKELSVKKTPFEIQLPHLMAFRRIYIEIVHERKINPNDRNDFRRKLLDKFIQMSRNDYNHLNARAINFLLNHIYDISLSIDRFEEYRIRTLAVDDLKELLRISDDSIEDDHSKKAFIEHRFPLYLHLCGKENEVIDELPEVYASSAQLVKQIFDRYMKLMMKGINNFRAKQIISKCDDRCEEIVITIIDIFYNKANRVEEKIKEDGLFLKIASYYTKYYQLTRGVVALCARIPLNEFFSKENFVLTKLKAGSEEFSMELFETINANDSLMVYEMDVSEEAKEQLGRIKNKAEIYLAHYYWAMRDTAMEGSALIVLMKNWLKLFNQLSHEEKIGELEAFSRFMIGIGYSMTCFFDLFKGLLDYMRSNSISLGISKESSESFGIVVYAAIALVLNEKVKASQEELNDAFYEKLIAFIKNESQIGLIKEHLLMKLEEAIKVSLQGKDLIMFSDL